MKAGTTHDVINKVSSLQEEGSRPEFALAWTISPPFFGFSLPHPPSFNLTRASLAAADQPSAMARYQLPGSSLWTRRFSRNKMSRKSQTIFCLHRFPCLSCVSPFSSETLTSDFYNRYTIDYRMNVRCSPFCTTFTARGSHLRRGTREISESRMRGSCLLSCLRCLVQGDASAGWLTSLVEEAGATCLFAMKLVTRPLNESKYVLVSEDLLARAW